jgi:hypothetical protein
MKCYEWVRVTRQQAQFVLENLFRSVPTLSKNPTRFSLAGQMQTTTRPAAGFARFA